MLRESNYSEYLPVRAVLKPILSNKKAKTRNRYIGDLTGVLMFY